MSIQVYEGDGEDPTQLYLIYSSHTPSGNYDTAGCHWRGPAGAFEINPDRGGRWTKDRALELMKEVACVARPQLVAECDLEQFLTERRLVRS